MESNMAVHLCVWKPTGEGKYKTDKQKERIGSKTGSKVLCLKNIGHKSSDTLYFRDLKT